MEGEVHKNRGNECVKAGNYEEAVEHYSRAIKADPSNYLYYSNRSAAYASLKKYSESLTDAQKTVELNPSWGKGYSRLGAALSFLNRKAEAIEAYRTGLEKDPGNEQLKASLADLEAQDEVNLFNKPEVLTKLLTDPRTKDFCNDPTFLAKLMNFQKDPSSCLSDPRMLTAFSVVTGIDLNKAAYSGGTPNHDSYSHQEPSSGSKSTNFTPEPGKKPPKPKEEPTTDAERAIHEKELGNKMYKQKQFQQAIEHYQKAKQLDNSSILLDLNIAAVYFEEGKLDECIKLCEEAVELGRSRREPFQNIAKAYARIGNAYKKQGNLQQALEAYNKSLSEFRDDEIVKKARQLERTIKELETKAYIDPEISEKERQLGNQLFNEGKFPEAVQHYTEAIKRCPTDPRLYSNRAACYTKLMEYQLCARDCDECIKLDPKFVKGYLRKANACLMLKEPHKARDSYLRVLECDPNNQEASVGLQKCYELIRKMNPDDAAEGALRDPEVQDILTDPTMRLILEQMKSDPQACIQYMSDPVISKKIEKLIEAGIIKIGTK